MACFSWILIAPAPCVPLPNPGNGSASRAETIKRPLDGMLLSMEPPTTTAVWSTTAGGTSCVPRMLRHSHALSAKKSTLPRWNGWVRSCTAPALPWRRCTAVMAASLLTKGTAGASCGAGGASFLQKGAFSVRVLRRGKASFLYTGSGEAWEDSLCMGSLGRSAQPWVGCRRRFRHCGRETVGVQYLRGHRKRKGVGVQ